MLLISLRVRVNMTRTLKLLPVYRHLAKALGEFSTKLFLIQLVMLAYVSNFLYIAAYSNRTSMSEEQQ